MDTSRNPTSADSSHQPAYESTWIGIGGQNQTTPLIQAGANSDVLSGGAGSYGAWYEIVGTNKDTQYEVPITNIQSNFSNGPGDTFYEDIWFTVDSSGNGDAHFYISDETSNKLASFDIPGITGWSGVTSTAEWIAERPSVNTTSAYYFPNPSYSSSSTHVSFSGCEAGSTGALAYPDPNASTTEYTKLQDTAGTLLNGVNTISTTGAFTTNWYDYGNGSPHK